MNQIFMSVGAYDHESNCNRLSNESVVLDIFKIKPLELVVKITTDIPLSSNI